MKTKFKNKNKIEKVGIRKIIIFTILLILFFTFFLLNYFNKKINDNLIKISSMEIEKKTKIILTKDINHDIINHNNISDILIIHKNNDDQILYVDFNLDKAYQVLDLVSNILMDSYQKLENGVIKVNYQNNDYHKTNQIFLFVPIGSALSSTYFYNVGPTIPVGVNFVGTILTNLETKITNYGLNNALVEVYVYIEFHNEIMAPYLTKDITLQYSSLIASMMIEGEVPSFYQGEITKSSSIYSKTIE